MTSSSLGLPNLNFFFSFNLGSFSNVNFNILFMVHLAKDENLCMLMFVQALIWSKMSTGLPIEISSSMKDQSYTSFCRLDIDIHRY